MATSKKRISRWGYWPKMIISWGMTCLEILLKLGKYKLIYKLVIINTWNTILILFTYSCNWVVVIIWRWRINSKSEKEIAVQTLLQMMSLSCCKQNWATFFFIHVSLIKGHNWRKGRKSLLMQTHWIFLDWEYFMLNWWNNIWYRRNSTIIILIP